MEPATGWGVHGGPCVDTLRSVEVKIEELEKTMMKHVVVKYIVQMYINCVVF